MRFSRLLVVAGAFLLSCSFLSAQVVAPTSPGSSGSENTQPAPQHPPTREQVLRLLDAMNVRANFETAMSRVSQDIKAGARQSYLKSHANADEATLKRLDKAIDDTPGIRFEDISEALIPIYQKNLEAADVQAAIDFYSSASGQRLLTKLPVMLRETQSTGGEIAKQKLEAYTAALDKKMREFAAETDKQNTK